MADTIPAITLDKEQYVDAYALASITVGKSLILQNRSTTPCRIVIEATQPALDATNYIHFAATPEVQAVIPAGQSGCWILGGGPIHVQEA